MLGESSLREVTLEPFPEDDQDFPKQRKWEAEMRKTQCHNVLSST